jgi:hypothetical protein
MAKKSNTRARRAHAAPALNPSHVSVKLSDLQDVHALAVEALDGLRAMRGLLDSSTFKQIRTEGLYQLLTGPMASLDSAVDELTPLAAGPSTHRKFEEIDA